MLEQFCKSSPISFYIYESELLQVKYAAIFRGTAGYRSVVLKYNLKVGDG
jgi:hypothetical protein